MKKKNTQQGFAVISRYLQRYRGAESSLHVAHPGYQVLSDILFRLGLIANALTQCSSQTVVLRL